MMLWFEVALAVLRELVRASVTPLRLLLYLPRRHYWRRIAREALASGLDGPATGLPDEEFLHALCRHQRRHRSAVPHLFISAGESSGEAHACQLVAQLRQGIRWTAFGGEPLLRAGAELRFPLSEHAVMGFLGVLRQLPLLLRAYHGFLRLLRDDPPDLAILVDYPGLHLVMAKACRRRGVPVLHYVAPQYWAWGPWRMRRYRRSVDATLTILPFETAFFARFRVPARYIGHPLLDEIEREPPDPAAVAALRLQPLLCLLPGSRRAEIAANLPGMLGVARALRRGVPGLRVVLPHKNPRRAQLLQRLLASADASDVELQLGSLGTWLAGARLTLAKSGTGSLEACLHGNPVVVVYQLRGLLSALAYHNILSVPHIAAANLVAGRTVVPEFCFSRRSGWLAVERAAAELWRDGQARERCIAGLAEVRQRLGAPGATARVAALVRGFLQTQEQLP